MAFVHIYMLIGTLAVLIPILLHLLNRQSPTKTPWAAMRFLRDSLIQRQRKILLEEILLMCVRCLLVMALALVATRPFLTPGARVSRLLIMPSMLLGTGLFAAAAVLSGSTFRRWRRRLLVIAMLLVLSGGAALVFEERLQARILSISGARDLALVLDASDTMTLGDGGLSNFVRAIEEAKALVRAAAPGTAFSIVVGASIPHAPVSIPTHSRDTVLEVLDGLEAGKGLMRAPETLSLAAYTLARGNHPAKQVVVFSDGQREGWNLSGGSADWKSVGETFRQLPGNPPVILRRLPFLNPLRNAAISSVDFTRAVFGLDRPVEIRIRIANHGAEAITPAGVRVTIGEDAYFDEGIGQIPPQGARTLSVAHAFKKTGPQLVEVELVVEDDLATDNKAWRVANPLERMDVLIVDENPGAGFFDRPGAFAALALAPIPETRRGGGPARDPATAQAPPLVHPRLIAVGDLEDLPNLENHAVVILADVAGLSPKAAEALARHVERGGGLLVAPGRAANPDFYNQWVLEGKAVLPARLAEHVSGENTHPVGESFTHPLLAHFASEALDLPQVILRSHWRLEALDGSMTVAELSNRDPFLVEKPFGNGRVLLLAASLDPQESNLVGSRAFVPLLHPLVYALAENRSTSLDAAARPGVTLDLAALAPTVARPALLEHLSRTSTLEIQDRPPGSAPAALRNGKLQPPPDLAPGPRFVRLPKNLAENFPPPRPADDLLPFALLREGREGHPDLLVESDSALLRRNLLWQEALTEEALKLFLDGSRTGRELWRPLALAGLLLMLAEIALSRWIALRRRTGKEVTVDFKTRGGPSEAFLKKARDLQSPGGIS